MANARRFLILLAVLATAVVQHPAGAQTSVPVTLSVPEASRTIYVENMLGGSLESLDFGSARSLPFRVRVVDSNYGAAPFTVNATMTNLYKTGGTWDDKIGSSKVSLGQQLDPLSATGVSAAVQPVFDLVATVDSTICTVLGLVSLNGSCTLNATDAVGIVQQLVVDASTPLANLPLLPQANDVGPFANAEYGAGTAGAGDPAASGAPAATPLAVAKGGLNADALQTLTALVATTPVSDVLTDATIVAAFEAAYPLVSSLDTGQLGDLVNATVASVQDLLMSDVLSLTGTYLSLPTLDIDTAAAPSGTFAGSLVLTATQ